MASFVNRYMHKCEPVFENPLEFIGTILPLLRFTILVLKFLSKGAGAKKMERIVNGL